jgi:VWFA-related protein
MRSFLSAVGCSVAVLIASSSAQQQPSVTQAPFRSGIDLVHVDVSVLDKDRHPVNGLTAADFTVREDGKVRPIAAFSAVTLPPRPAPPSVPWMRDVAPDVVTNLVPREGRLVVILLDRTIPNENMPIARRTAEAAVDQLGPGDLAAVIYSVRGVPQNFTADRKLLVSAINQPFVGFGDDGTEGQRGECWCGLCSLETMTHVAEALRDVPQRRKMLLFIGSTLPLESREQPPVTSLSSDKRIQCNLEIKDAREKLIRAAGVANLTIHTFDTSLLESLAPTAAHIGVPSTDRTAIAGAHLDRQNNLAFYPAETGGRAIGSTNAPWDPIPAVFEESASYYVLGFTPASPRADGRYHDIKIDVNRRKTSVHSRQGYYGPSTQTRSKPPTRGGPAQSLVDTLAGLWPKTEIPLGVTVDPFVDPGKSEAAVAVIVRAREPVSLDPSRDGQADTTQGPGPANVSVLAGAYGRDGHSVDSHVQTLSVTPPKQARGAFEYEILSRLRLKPGRHEIRVAVEDATRNLRGSVYTYVDVPDFSRAALSLSGIVLSPTPAAPRGVLNDLMPIAPSAQRQFTATARVSVFARVYDKADSGTVPVTVTARVIDDDGHTSFEQTSKAIDMRGSPIRSADYRLDLDLSHMTKGENLLTIEARRGAQRRNATYGSTSGERGRRLFRAQQRIRSVRAAFNAGTNVAAAARPSIRTEAAPRTTGENGTNTGSGRHSVRHIW